MGNRICYISWLKWNNTKLSQIEFSFSSLSSSSESFMHGAKINVYIKKCFSSVIFLIIPRCSYYYADLPTLWSATSIITG